MSENNKDKDKFQKQEQQEPSLKAIPQGIKPSEVRRTSLLTKKGVDELLGEPITILNSKPPSIHSGAVYLMKKTVADQDLIHKGAEYGKKSSFNLFAICAFIFAIVALVVIGTNQNLSNGLVDGLQRPLGQIEAFVFIVLLILGAYLIIKVRSKKQA